MSTPITCTFKVPTSSDEFAYIGENGIGIKFSDMLDPTNAVLTRTESRNNSMASMYAGSISMRPLIPVQCKAAVLHYYKKVVLPHIDHPDKESDNFFFAWLLAALPNKIPGWNIEKWREVFKNNT